MAIQVVLSVGAIYSLIPIIIIIILIAAAVGLTRGTDLFAVFGIGALLGLKGTIGTGATGKGMTRGPTIPKSTVDTFKRSGAKAGGSLRGTQKYIKNQKAVKAEAGKLVFATGMGGNQVTGLSSEGKDGAAKAVAAAGTAPILEALFVKQAVKGNVEKGKHDRVQAASGVIQTKATTWRGTPWVAVPIPGMKSTVATLAWLGSLRKAGKDSTLTREVKQGPGKIRNALARSSGRFRQSSLDIKNKRQNQGVPILRRLSPNSRFGAPGQRNAAAESAYWGGIHDNFKKTATRQDYQRVMAQAKWNLTPQSEKDPAIERYSGGHWDKARAAIKSGNISEAGDEIKAARKADNRAAMLSLIPFLGATRQKKIEQGGKTAPPPEPPSKDEEEKARKREEAEHERVMKEEEERRRKEKESKKKGA